MSVRVFYFFLFFEVCWCEYLIYCLDGEWWFVLELVEGGEVFEVIDEELIINGECFEFFVVVCGLEVFD